MKHLLIILTLMCVPSAVKARFIAGYTLFCMESPTNCPESSPEVIEWNWDVSTELKDVAQYVSWNIEWVEEPDTDDVWQCGNTGDCEDHAICARNLLIKRGFSPGALRLGVGTTQDGGHAFLTINTSDGLKVLHWGRVESIERAPIKGIFLEGGKWREKTGYSWIPLTH